jgi:hypothetical protein
MAHSHHPFIHIKETDCSPSPCERFSRFRFYGHPCQFRVLYRPYHSIRTDYYGSSVTMPVYHGFRQSPVAYIILAFHVVGRDFRHLSPVLGSPGFGYHTSACIIPTVAETTCVSDPFACRLVLCPGSDYRSGSLAFILIRGFSSPYPPIYLGLYASADTLCLLCGQKQHAALPIGFSPLDKLRDDRLFLTSFL